jgi:hypothetical protein
MQPQTVVYDEKKIGLLTYNQDKHKQSSKKTKHKRVEISRESHRLCFVKMVLIKYAATAMNFKSSS